MKILTIDIGTGTQDIFLYDSQLDIENGYKLIVPSPTLMVNRRLRAAAQAGRPAALNGRLMGGGPSAWGADALLKAGLTLYATPQAARSFNDDLEQIREMGVTLVSEDELAALPPEVERIEMRDLDFPAIARAFAQFDVSLDDLAAVAVGVFDHGDAPPEVSDRQFRFDYLNERIEEAHSHYLPASPDHPAFMLSAFAYQSYEIPEIMTRMQAVADSARDVDAPLVVMDTAPAAVLGATFDPHVRQREQLLVANVGNMHTLAFRLGSEGVEGVFEHHTGFLDCAGLDALLRSLADGTLQHADVFGHHGHGALVYADQPFVFPPDDFGVVVTGPRRSLMLDSALRPYFAAPFGDMMIAGCFGILAAVSELLPETRSAIRSSLLSPGAYSSAPWEE
jgi:uncharacterized protein (DUF1786 family)